ncbi:anhydro-N-acetylmuramic acid kinase [Bartonella sp. HY329]|uniref:anhydro-N-acetylmuramic acid kinase n=1 Tax=unclassified Bartonella TaxID=2645622 RepID=UPI0021C94618|nr:MULTISPECIES: anhydro-N-acetylmuramic acid kinase [unclassified Bartonella]UXM96300.1 anhydro-N-acetylmuramic acid kinase [Bartonella sp. HY329]UXN10624.1 anhydro-N-acetylmuramic acid kinase [Bartonella sp. HY328]
MKKQDLKMAIGLMSGTSMDGIDAALIESDGLSQLRIISTFSHSYSTDFRNRLKQSLDLAQGVTDRTARPHRLDALEHDLTLEHVMVVKSLLEKLELNSDLIDVIGFHGQTILHRPNTGLTLQLGDGSLLARRTGIDVVFDMRANDMRYQGQGAPLVPIYHAALAAMRHDYLKFPVAFINIGGISNLTLVKTPNLKSDDNIIAFDCGPGNVLIDQWMTLNNQGNFDKDGQAGLAGQVNQQVLDAIMLDIVYQQNTKQSLDWRNFKPLTDKTISLEDGAASLAFLTAKQIFSSFKFLSEKPKQLIISGGGVRNKAIIKYLQFLGKPFDIDIIAADDIGLNSAFIEAEAWGYLAIRSMKSLPLTYPKTTGCITAVSGGVFVSAKP